MKGKSDEWLVYLSGLTVAGQYKRVPNLFQVQAGQEMAMTPSEPLIYDPPKVHGIDDSDPEGVIPPELLVTGIEAVVPIWPRQSPDGTRDTLTVNITRGTTIEFTWSDSYLTPIKELEFIIPIGPEYLLVDGVVELSYETRNFLGNPAPSLPRKLTIDHMPVVRDLTPVEFPAATPHGYLNCSTSPPIWSGIEIKVPPLPVFTQAGDKCVVEWFGYLSPNGSGDPIDRTYKSLTKDPLAEQEIINGYSTVVGPFVPHIEPMINRASAVAHYSIYRGSKLIAVSKQKMVKIDRIVTGEIDPCGPVFNEV
jgi:hypothetical protein